MFGRKRKWTAQVDVIVLGSGGGGLTAAIAAHDEGASVLVLEKSDTVGGTTAVSGGVIWVPNNHHMAQVGIDDDHDEAFGYMKRIADGRTEDELIERYLEAAPHLVRYLEEKTPVRFAALGHYPDYHPEFVGGRLGGRSLETGLFDTGVLGEWAGRLRRSPVFGATPMTVEEATSWGVFSKPLSLPYRELAERYKKGLVCYGASLVGGLLKGCLDRNIEPMLGVRACDLVVEDGVVVGVVAEQEGEQVRFGARKGVILATGGFEWNADLNARFLGGQLTHPNSPPVHHGDGLIMAMAQGADLGNMNEAWWCPSVVVPGEEYDGMPLHRGDFAIRSLPHSIIVNRKGQRFVNEAHNYNDMMKPFFHFDPVDYDRPNLPAWLVVDSQFMAKYLLVTVAPGMPVPDWVDRADSLGDLAGVLGVDPAGLQSTVDRFNQFAEDGVDLDFRRGESVYDHFYGDPDNHPNPNLGSISVGPFYGLRVYPGAIGTKGGPKVDVEGRVRKVGGGTIPGLYAAGNAMAAVMGPGYPGAGSTIGTAMTWGWLAGRHAAGKRNA